MKILYVLNIFNPSAGGAIGVVVDEMLAMVREGHQVSLFTGSQSKPEESRTYDWKGISITEVPIRKVSWVLKSYVGLRNRRIEKLFSTYVAEFRPDVILLHNLYFHFPFSLIKRARAQCNKVFFTAHDAMSISPRKLFHFVSDSTGFVDPQKYYLSLYEEWRQNGKAFNPFRRFAVRYYLRYATTIFAVSKELSLALTVNHIQGSVVLYNPVDSQAFVPNKAVSQTIRSTYGLEKNKVVLTAGRLSVMKGGIAVIHILHELLRFVPEAILMVLSDVEHIDMMKNEARKLGCEKSLCTIASVPRHEIAAYYAASDVVILPSLCLETFGMVTAEAMACEKPVVVTSFGGSREMVEVGVNGYIDNPLHFNMFAEDIARTLTDKGLEMGKHSRNIVLKRFDQALHMRQLLAHYSA